jgi:hypothetical protein
LTQAQAEGEPSEEPETPIENLQLAAIEVTRFAQIYRLGGTD